MFVVAMSITSIGEGRGRRVIGAAIWRPYSLIHATTFTRLQSGRVNDRADVLAVERRLDAFGVAAINELERAQQPRVVEQVEDDAVKGQGLKAALAYLAAADLADEVRARVPLRVAVVK